MSKMLKGVFVVIVISVISAIIVFPIISNFTAKHRDITPDFCKGPDAVCFDMETSLDEYGWPFVYERSTCCGIGGEMTSFKYPNYIIDFIIVSGAIFMPMFALFYIIIILLNTLKYDKDKGKKTQNRGKKR